MVIKVKQINHKITKLAVIASMLNDKKACIIHVKWLIQMLENQLFQIQAVNKINCHKEFILEPANKLSNRIIKLGD